MYHDNIIFTDQENIEHMNFVPKIKKILQVSGEIDEDLNTPHKQWKLTTSLIPCSCPSYNINPLCGACIYKEERAINMIVVYQKTSNGNATVCNDFDVLTMKVKELKIELKERRLPFSGLKAALIARLLDYFRLDVDHDPEAEELPMVIKDMVSDDTTIGPMGNK